MSQPRGCRLRAPNEWLRRTTPWGTQWGQLDGRSGRPLLRGGGISRRSGVSFTSVKKAAPAWFILTSALLREGCVAARGVDDFGFPPRARPVR